MFAEDAQATIEWCEAMKRSVARVRRKAGRTGEEATTAHREEVDGCKIRFREEAERREDDREM